MGDNETLAGGGYNCFYVMHCASIGCDVSANAAGCDSHKWDACERFSLQLDFGGVSKAVHKAFFTPFGGAGWPPMAEETPKR